MADETKVTLGIDIEALQRSAGQAASILQKAFEGQNLGPNVLGSGVPANQLPQQGGNKDTLRGVIDALERIERTLTVGFTAMSGGASGVGAGAGGGAGSGGGGGGGQAPTQPPAGGRGGGSYGMGTAISRAGDLASALMPSSMNMFSGGFYSTDVVGMANTVASQIPVAGKLLSAMISPFHQTMQQNDNFRDRQYDTFRDSGPNAMAALTDLWTRRDGDDQSGLYEQFTKKYGMSQNETQSLVGSGFKNGLNFGNRGMEAVMNMQGVLGLGTEAANTGGALQRGGLAKGGESDALASAIGVAVSTGLERGRWGEMLTMWQRAAQSSIDTDVSVKSMTEESNFVGSMGGRFQGDTAASESMKGALKGMTSDQGSALALSTALTQSGGSWFKATNRMARSAEQFDSQLANGILDKLMDVGAVKAYMESPDESGLDDAAGMAAMYLPRNVGPLKAAEMLKARKAGKTPLGHLVQGAMDIANDIINGNAPLPETALKHRRSETRKQLPSDLTSLQEGGSSRAYHQSMGPGQATTPPADGTGGVQGSQGAITSPDQDSSGSNVPGMGSLSDTDIQSAAEQAGIPTETMRSWFRMESGGDIQSRDDGRGLEDWRGARGYAQITLEEAQSLGYSKADWVRMSTDKKLSLEASAKLAARYYSIAKQNAPSGWSDADKLHLMKYQHGGGGYAKAGITDYRKHHGGADPASWSAYYDAEKGSKSLGGGLDETQAHRALNNANNLTVTIKVDQSGKVVGHNVRTNAASGSMASSPGQVNTASRHG